jgi:stage III sporulation protein AD
MNIISVSALAVAAVVMIVTLKPKNAEIAIVLGIAASSIILFSLFGHAAEITRTVTEIAAGSGIATGYIAVLLKVVGICLVTEFAANTCRDSGSSSLAGTVTLTGKLLITAAALPLYSDILATVSQLIRR